MQNIFGAIKLITVKLSDSCCSFSIKAIAISLPLISAIAIRSDNYCGWMRYGLSNTKKKPWVINKSSILLGKTKRKTWCSGKKQSYNTKLDILQIKWNNINIKPENSQIRKWRWTFFPRFVVSWNQRNML